MQRCSVGISEHYDVSGTTVENLTSKKYPLPLRIFCHLSDNLRTFSYVVTGYNAAPKQQFNYIKIIELTNNAFTITYSSFFKIRYIKIKINFKSFFLISNCDFKCNFYILMKQRFSNRFSVLFHEQIIIFKVFVENTNKYIECHLFI